MKELQDARKNMTEELTNVVFNKESTDLKFDERMKEFASEINQAQERIEEAKYEKAEEVEQMVNKQK